MSLEMDVLYLHKLGLVFSNVRNMLRDRGYDVTELNACIGQTTLETAGLLYKRSRILESSLAEAGRFVVIKQSKKTYLWLLDRNYDLAKLKERMTSTDQIKAIYDLIDAEPLHTHLVVVPTKCSPQAKKEMHSCAEFFIFDELLIDLPRHVLVSEHSLVTEEQLKKYLGDSFQQQDLPILPLSDPIRKWYGWAKGSLVFINNPIMPKFKIVC